MRPAQFNVGLHACAELDGHGTTERRHAQRNDFHLTFEREVVARPMEIGEAHCERRAVVARCTRDIEFVALSHIPHARVPGEAVGRATCCGACGERIEPATELCRLQRRRGPHDTHRGLATGRGNGESEGAEHAGTGRHKNGAHAEEVGERARVQRPTTAKGHEHAATRVDPALHAHPAQGTRDLGIGDRDDRLRRTLGRGAETHGKRGDCGARGHGIERYASREMRRVEPAERDVCVGDRG